MHSCCADEFCFLYYFVLRPANQKYTEDTTYTYSTTDDIVDRTINTTKRDDVISRNTVQVKDEQFSTVKTKQVDTEVSTSHTAQCICEICNCG